MTGVLVVCTANICRSPMAAALLVARVSRAPEAVVVRSAGSLGDGMRPPAEAVAAAAAYGVDTSEHRSHLLAVDDLLAADLVLAMAREHVRNVVTMLPSTWQRCFTLKELVRRGTQIGPRRPGEPLAAWLERAGGGRMLGQMLGSSSEDDVADPIGGPQVAYDETAALLVALVDELVGLAWAGQRSAPEDTVGP